MDNSFIMCWYSGQNLFASSSELSEFIEDMGRFLHFSDPCDDKDGSSDSWVVDDFSDSSNVNIGGPQILQILFAIDFIKVFNYFHFPLCRSVLTCRRFQVEDDDRMAL